MKDENEVHFCGKIALKAIVVQEDKVLLVRDPRSTIDAWELPGGRMNEDEAPEDAMKREFLEEMGREIDVFDVVHMEQFEQGNEKAKAFVIVYRANLADDADFKIKEDEVSDMDWFTKKSIDEINIYPEHQRALDTYFKNI